MVVIPGFVTEIRLAPDGSGVWVHAFVPVVDPDEIDFMSDPMTAPDGLHDTIISWVRLEPNGLGIRGYGPGLTGFSALCHQESVRTPPRRR